MIVAGPLGVLKRPLYGYCDDGIGDIQYGLRTRGQGVRVTGIWDYATDAALSRVLPGWDAGSGNVYENLDNLRRRLGVAGQWRVEVKGLKIDVGPSGCHCPKGVYEPCMRLPIPRSRLGYWVVLGGAALAALSLAVAVGRRA